MLARLFTRASTSAKPFMSQADIDTIRAFALGDETKRLEAIQAHRRNLGSPAATSLYMRFMSEIDTPAPDLMLRYDYRRRIQQEA